MKIVPDIHDFMEESLVKIDLGMDSGDENPSERYTISDRRNHSQRKLIDEIYKIYLISFYRALGVDGIQLGMMGIHSPKFLFIVENLGVEDGSKGIDNKKSIGEFARSIFSDYLLVLDMSLAAS